MIKLQNLTPEVYYQQSRDFQLIGRLYDLVLNSIKTNADLIKALPLSDNSDEQLVELMSLTLGFKSRHKYNVKQLTAICNVLSEVLRKKGSLEAIEIVCNALLYSEGSKYNASVTVDTENAVINIVIPTTLTDTNLLTDLLIYILPAGMLCNIIRTVEVSLDDTTTISYYKNAGVSIDSISNVNETSFIVKPGDVVISSTDSKVTEANTNPGYLANSEVYMPTALSFNATTNITNAIAKTEKVNSANAIDPGTKMKATIEPKEGYTWYVAPTKYKLNGEEKSGIQKVGETDVYTTGEITVNNNINIEFNDGTTKVKETN